MRAPPPPRKSKSHCLTRFCLRIRQVCTGYGLKKRWHLHKLHKVRRKGEMIVSPLSGLHAEDMINLPTGLQKESAKRKPLLIAVFSRGCAKSPQLRLLQRNKLYGLPLTQRKYKLKEFEATVTEKGVKNQSNIQMTLPCASRVGSIKKATSKNADVRVIFHNQNVIKTTNLCTDLETALQSPQFLEFTSRQSIKIGDYPSLVRRPLELEEICESNNHEEIEKSERMFNREREWRTSKFLHGGLSNTISPESSITVVSRNTRPSIFQLKSFTRINKYSNTTTLVSYSKLINSYTSFAS
ncbi:OSW1 (YOR255W) [Zygosaccharomyces parabailii]|nr:OSW1 (YOR255W) [Zygosaccharomyces parabailii]